MQSFSTAAQLQRPIAPYQYYGAVSLPVNQYPYYWDEPPMQINLQDLKSKYSPTIHVPKINVPKINVPKIDVPKIDVPNYGVPKLPGSHGYDIPKFPDIGVPKTGAPDFNVPDLSVPTLPGPQGYDIPKFPDISVPPPLPSLNPPGGVLPAPLPVSGAPPAPKLGGGAPPASLPGGGAPPAPKSGGGAPPAPKSGGGAPPAQKLGGGAPPPPPPVGTSPKGTSKRHTTHKNGGTSNCVPNPDKLLSIGHIQNAGLGNTINVGRPTDFNNQGKSYCVNVGSAHNTGSGAETNIGLQILSLRDSILAEAGLSFTPDKMLI